MLRKALCGRIDELLRALPVVRLDRDPHVRERVGRIELERALRDQRVGGQRFPARAVDDQQRGQRSHQEQRRAVYGCRLD